MALKVKAVERLLKFDKKEFNGKRYINITYWRGRHRAV